MDVVYAVYGSDKIQWERNDGNQNFSTLTIDDNNAPTTIAAIDLDQDGDVDIVNHPDFRRIVWYENDGNQNFTKNIASNTAGGCDKSSLSY